jgi:hypothetical protein
MRPTSAMITLRQWHVFHTDCVWKSAVHLIRAFLIRRPLALEYQRLGLNQNLPSITTAGTDRMPQFLGASENPTVQHVAHDNFARRASLPPYRVN